MADFKNPLQLGDMRSVVVVFILGHLINMTEVPIDWLRAQWR